jgi:O-antigen/teichoic acid export membrane protein
MKSDATGGAPIPEASHSPARGSRSIRPSLFRSVLTNWAAFFVSAGIGFFLSPFIVRKLGDVQYGLWILVGSLVGYLGFLDLGVRGAVTRYVARQHAAGDDRAASGITSTALAVFVIAGVLSVATGLVVSGMIGHLFEIPVEDITDARVAVLLGGFTIGVSLIGGVFGGAVVGLERFDVINALEICVELARGAAVWIVLRNGGGLVGLASVQLSVSVVRTIGSAVLMRRLYPGLIISRRLVSKEAMRTVLTLGLSVTVLNVASALALYSDSMVIGAILPVAMVTFFANGANLTNYARSIVSGMSWVMAPRSSHLEQTSGPAAVGELLLASGRHASLVALPILITFMIRGATFIGLWMGPSYAIPSGRIVAILSIAMVFSSARQIIGTALVGMERHYQLIPIYVIESLVNVVLSVLLIHPMGIDGVAWGTTIPSLVVTCGFLPWYARRAVGVSIRAQIIQFWVRPLAAMIPFAIATYIVEHRAPPTNLVAFFGQVASIVGIAFAGTWVIGMTPLERRDLTDRARIWVTFGRRSLSGS